MTDSPSYDEPEWLQSFQELANQELGEGSACDQIHPIILRWFDALMSGEPSASRDSVMQAMSCLATEVLNSSPDHLLDALFENVTEEDEIVLWVEQILLIGRAFEVALREGELDDL